MTVTNRQTETAGPNAQTQEPQYREWKDVPPSPRAPVIDPRLKSPVLAMVLSLMPGLGQVYIGYYKRGFIHILVVASVISFLASATDSHALAPLFGLFLAFFWMYNLVDAGRRASLYNNALHGEEAIEPPSDFKMPGKYGAAVGGVCLMALGGILLSNTLFGISLAWIENWWPVGLFVPGAWLIIRAFQEKTVKS